MTLRAGYKYADKVNHTTLELDGLSPFKKDGGSKGPKKGPLQTWAVKNSKLFLAIWRAESLRALDLGSEVLDRLDRLFPCSRGAFWAPSYESRSESKDGVKISS